MGSDENELLTALLSGAQSRLQAHVSTADLQQGQVLAEPLEAMTRVYFPYSGVISFLVPLKDGHLVQTGLVGRDGTVGAVEALDGKTSLSRAVVLVPGRAAVVQAERLAEAIRDNPALRAVIQRHEQFFLAEVQQSAACNAVHDVRQRVCRWILRMNDLVGMNVAVTQDLLAGIIGVRRTTVTLAAASLQDEGIIRYRRGHIQIADIDRLKQLSCECYQSLRDYRHVLQPPVPQKPHARG